MQNTTPALGDIILIGLDPQKGVETTKTRPALVVSRTKNNKLTGLVWICPITSNRNPFPTHIFLDSTTKTHGKIMVDQIRALDFKARGWALLEKAPIEIVMQVENIIRAITCVEDERMQII